MSSVSDVASGIQNVTEVVQENTESIVGIQKQIKAVDDSVEENEKIIQNLYATLGGFKL
jgi:methyl-accepting chemotaxis protein